MKVDNLLLLMCQENKLENIAEARYILSQLSIYNIINTVEWLVLWQMIKDWSK